MSLFEEALKSFASTGGRELGKTMTQKRRGQKKDVEDRSLGEVAKVALPIILYGLYKNSKNKEEKESLDRAVNDHKENQGGLKELMEGLRPDESKKMVDHVFRGKGQNVSRNIANQAGVSQEEVDAVLERLTPSVIAMLAEEKKKGKDVEESMESAMKDLDQRQDMSDIVSGAKKFIESGTEDGSLLSGIGNVLKNILG
ncbi:MAG: DUF937 domain-containing protein [Tissierellia bacterium]|nr:DUF937 domain-containing protein [Tissierellia bacterium]